MAKKNLSSLMSGIMGQPETEESGSTTTSSAAGSNEELKTEENKKPGRPRNPEPEVRATFIVDPELIRKIKYINLVDGNLQKDIIDTALRQYIRQWEAKNGTINLPERK